MVLWYPTARKNWKYDIMNDFMKNETHENWKYASKQWLIFGYSYILNICVQV